MSEEGRERKERESGGFYLKLFNFLLRKVRF